MAMLAWKESYSVGIKTLDDQHKRLLELVNQLSVLNPGAPDKKEIFSVLNALVVYAQTHFDTEEEYLKKYDYPRLIQQQREHVTFVADVFRLAKELEQNEPRIHRKVSDFVSDWYGSHILGTDREYKDFLRAKGAT